ncbi:hypothetical protein BC829DRAFT_494641 [Chytridium lagenaria]|nr:hypothetical protein BC829DRAFT_494641 [Chytridium lagenaria]
MPSKTKSKKGKAAAADQAKKPETPAASVPTTSTEAPVKETKPEPVPVAEVKAAAPVTPAIKKVKRTPLIGDQDQLTTQVVAALLEIFGRFDDDNDAALSREELEAFAIATNGEKFEEEAVNELKKSFNVDANGNLTRRGFLEMYQLQTLSDPDETWRDLIKHGYSVKLQLIRRATATPTPTGRARRPPTKHGTSYKF